MHKQSYDWLFIFAVVIVLAAFVATSIQAFGDNNNSILAIIAAIGGLLSNIAASRFERKDQKYITGALNPWFVGLVTGRQDPHCRECGSAGRWLQSGWPLLPCCLSCSDIRIKSIPGRHRL
jgi:hypothetical protein